MITAEMILKFLGADDQFLPGMKKVIITQILPIHQINYTYGINVDSLSFDFESIHAGGYRIKSNNPKYDFIRIVEHFWPEKISDTRIYPKLEGKVKFGLGITIGNNGFGFARDEYGHYHRFSHIGGVRIGADVEIGNHTNIDRGALTDTIIGTGTKIDAHVHIGHGAIIGEDCLICAGAIIGGSSKIGNNVFIGLGSIIRNGIIIEDQAYIGQMTNVIKNIPKGPNIWVGNPARILRAIEDK